MSTAGGEPDFARLEPAVARVLELLLPATSLRLVNVNFPADPKRLCWTRQSVQHYDGHVVAGEDPLGRRMFWITVRPIEQVEEGTDLWAVQHGLVSITPLRLDLTDGQALADAKARMPLDGQQP